MSPRALLLTGIGLLVAGLLLVLSIETDPLTTDGPRAGLAQGYLSNACLLVGSSLSVAAALLSALRRRAPTEPPSIDHYS